MKSHPSTKLKMAPHMFTMHTRNPYRVETRSTLQAAIDAGFALGVPFDVHVESGAVAWVWEMRP
jgi:hypothetical protein